MDKQELLDVVKGRNPLGSGLGVSSFVQKLNESI